MKLGWANRATGGKMGLAWAMAALVWPFSVWVCNTTVDKDGSTIYDSVRWVAMWAARWVSFSRVGGVSGNVNLSKSCLSLSLSHLSLFFSFFPSFFACSVWFWIAGFSFSFFFFHFSFFFFLFSFF